MLSSICWQDLFGLTGLNRLEDARDFFASGGFRPLAHGSEARFVVGALLAVVAFVVGQFALLGAELGQGVAEREFANLEVLVLQRPGFEDLFVGNLFGGGGFGVGGQGSWSGHREHSLGRGDHLHDTVAVELPLEDEVGDHDGFGDERGEAEVQKQGE